MEKVKYLINYVDYQNDITKLIDNNIHSKHPNSTLKLLSMQQRNRMNYLSYHSNKLIMTTLPLKINIMKSFYKNRKKIVDYVKSLKKFYLSRGQQLVPNHNNYYYKYTITSSTDSFTIKDNQFIDVQGLNPYHQLKSVIKRLNHNIQREYSIRILINHIVTKFPKAIHSHGIIVSTAPINIPTIEAKVNRYLSLATQYHGINIRIKPLIDYATNHQVVLNASYDNDNSKFKAIQQWLTYCYKSYKLPFLNGTKDLNKWNQLSDNQKINFIIAVLNSTSGVRTSYMYSFKRKVNNIRKYIATTYRLSYIRFELALYSVIEPLLLLNLTDIDDNQNIRYYKYNNRSAIGGTSAHYGWLDHYKQELNQERLERDARSATVEPINIFGVRTPALHFSGDTAFQSSKISFPGTTAKITINKKPELKLFNSS